MPWVTHCWWLPPQLCLVTSFTVTLSTATVTDSSEPCRLPLLLSCLQVRAHALSNRADVVFHRVCLILASEKLFCSGA